MFLAAPFQKIPDFCLHVIAGRSSAHRLPEHVFGAVRVEIAVPDQLRSAVRGPDRYEPDINATYQRRILRWRSIMV